MASLRFISFFAGIGGIDLGLERAGHICVGQVENNEFCNKVLAKRWPHIPRWGDIREVDANELPEADLWCGGDPCQANSRARGPWGTRKKALALPFLSLINAGRPRFVLRENPAAVMADAPWPWQRVRCHLERAGYAVLPFRLRACCLGADHKRERLFLLAERADALRTGLERRRQCELSAASLQEELGRRARTPIPKMVGISSWLGSRAARLRSSHGFSRRLDRHAIEALGNAVVPQVAEYIGKLLYEATEKQ